MHNRMYCLLLLILSLGLMVGCSSSGSSSATRASSGEETGQQDQPSPPTFAGDLGDRQFFFGNFHSHSQISGAQGTPEEALTWARDTFDFYVMTDHSEEITPDEWEALGNAVDGFTAPGAFVALRGFEWSNPLFGHICVYNTSEYTNSILTFCLSLFYLWLEIQPDALAQFNHPGREPLAFNNLAYNACVADNFFAMETGNKDDGNATGPYLAFYPAILDEGWMVAPTSNQDNHSLNANAHRSVMIADNLSRESLLEAMRARRIYSSDDPNLQIIFKLGTQWMGSEVERQGGEKLCFTVWVRDDEPITKVTLHGRQGIVLAEQDLEAGTTETYWSPAATLTEDAYFYLQVEGENTVVADGQDTTQIAVTAPIWVRLSEP